MDSTPPKPGRSGERPATRLRSLRLPSPPLACEHVLLRGLRGQDVSDITAACQDPEIQRWTSVGAPYGESDARGWLAGMRAREKAGSALELAIADAASGRLVGAIGLTALDWRHRVGELGYWVAPAARGNGTASFALRLMSRWALGPVGLDRAQVRIRVGNDASRRVAEAAGFTFEGVLRGSFRDRERSWDMAVYGLVSDDLRDERAPVRRAELGPAPAPTR